MRPGLPNSKFDSMSVSLIVANFFQSRLFCFIKTGSMEVNCY